MMFAVLGAMRVPESVHDLDPVAPRRQCRGHQPRLATDQGDCTQVRVAIQERRQSRWAQRRGPPSSLTVAMRATGRPGLGDLGSAASVVRVGKRGETAGIGVSEPEPESPDVETRKTEDDDVEVNLGDGVGVGVGFGIGVGVGDGVMVTVTGGVISRTTLATLSVTKTSPAGLTMRRMGPFSSAAVAGPLSPL